MASGRIKGITIQIGGDTTELVKALAKVDNALSKTQTNLRDINKALKLDPSNTALLKDKQEELAKAIDLSKSRLEEEKKAYQELSKADKTPENIEKMRRLEEQIDLDTVALKDLERQARESASVLGTQFQIAGEKIQEVGSKISAVGDKMVQLGTTLTTRVTVPIVTGFTAAIKTTADFDAQMSKVKAISGATADEFDTLRDKAREMGEKTKFSATESGEAFEYMAMAGWKSEEMLQGIEGIMNLAAASGEELGKTSDIVTDALTALGMSAEESGRLADILAAAATNSNTNVAMMGDSFKYAATTAGLLGYSAEDVAVALGLMANSGIKADMAGTSLRNMFNRMAKPTKESAEAMERLGLSLYDDEGQMYSLRQIMDQLRQSFTEINMPLDEYNLRLDEMDGLLAAGDITQKQYEKSLKELNLQAFGAEGAEKARAAAMLGGTRAMAGLAAIANASTEDYEQLTKAIDGSSESFAKLADGSVVPLNEALASGQEIIEQYNGAAEAMAMTMQDNLEGQLTILKSQLQELAISLGDLIMPMIRDFVSKIQEVVNWLNGLDDAQKEQIMKIAAIVAAVGPALLIIGNVVRVLGGLVTIIGAVVRNVGLLMTFIGGLTAPVMIVIGAITALVAAFVYFYNTNEEFRNKVNAVIDSVKEKFSAFIEAAKVWLDNLIAWISPVVESVKGYLTAIWDLVKTIAELIGNYITGWLEKHKTAIDMWISTIKMIFQVGFDFIKGYFQSVWEIMRGIVTTVLNVMSNLIKAFTSVLKGDWQSAWDYVKQATQAAVNGVSNTISNLKSIIGNTLNSIISSMRNWGADMIDSLVGGIKSKIASVGSAVAGVASTIKSYIHFSEPDVGPLSDFNTYMPDMIKGMVTGIENGIPQIQTAMTDLAGSMVPNTMTDSVGSKSMTNNNSVNITVYGAQGQDVSELADIIQERINAQVYSNGAAFA